MAQHASLTLDRWSGFPLDQQVLMIANEMHRAAKLMDSVDRARLERGYERVLHLTDLTIRAAGRPALRRELLRWRDLVAWLYVQPASARGEHAAALRALLQLTPAASRQLAELGLR